MGYNVVYLYIIPPPPFFFTFCPKYVTCRLIIRRYWVFGSMKVMWQKFGCVVGVIGRNYSLCWSYNPEFTMDMLDQTISLDEWLSFLFLWPFALQLYGYLVSDCQSHFQAQDPSRPQWGLEHGLHHLRSGIFLPTLFLRCCAKKSDLYLSFSLSLVSTSKPPCQKENARCRVL